MCAELCKLYIVLSFRGRKCNLRRHKRDLRSWIAINSSTVMMNSFEPQINVTYQLISEATGQPQGAAISSITCLDFCHDPFKGRLYNYVNQPLCYTYDLIEATRFVGTMELIYGCRCVKAR